MKQCHKAVRPRTSSLALRPSAVLLRGNHAATTNQRDMLCTSAGKGVKPPQYDAQQWSMGDAAVSDAAERHEH